MGRAVLVKVVDKLGGIAAAAARLGVAPASLNRFLDGTVPVPVPDAVLLRAVDIVLDEFQQDPSGKSQPFNRTEP